MWGREEDFALTFAMSAYVAPLALPAVASGAAGLFSAGARREPTDREVDPAFMRIVLGMGQNGGWPRW